MSGRTWQTRLRRRVGSTLADGFFRGASRLGRLHPTARPEHHGVEHLVDIPYDLEGGPPHRRLDALGTPCQAPVYSGSGHAFHAFVFRREARRCWRDTHAFLDRHMGEPSPPR